MDRKYDAFISYRRGSGYYMAQLVCDRMQERGIKCYLDLKADRQGHFGEHLISAVESAAYLILVLSPNALDDCVVEDDWVRQEIATAFNNGVRIVPLLLEEFKWPNSGDWFRAVPPEFAELPYQQGVVVRKEYLAATMEKLASYLRDVAADPLPERKEPMPSRGPAFVQYCMKEKNVERVDMAFHAGANWHRDDEHLDILDELVAKKLPVRVLINDAQTVENICIHLRRPRKTYVPFQEAVADWARLQAEHPEVFQVRVCPLPLLHRMYLVHGDKGLGYTNVHYYTYGPYNPAKDSWATYDANTPEFWLYANEFEYLWERSTPAEL